MSDFWTRYLEEVAKPLAATYPRRRGCGGRPADSRLHRFRHDDGREVVATISDGAECTGMSVSSLRELRRGAVEKARGWRYAGVVES